MAFKLSELGPHSNFEPVVEANIISFDDPPLPLRPVFFPVFGDRAATVRSAAERVRSRVAQNPEAFRWVQAVDPATGRVAGAALWVFFRKDPYTGRPWPRCTWWPEGEGRDFANAWAWGIRWPRVLHMSKAHAYLNICFVHPDFRRQGIGRALVEWGLQRADEMGLEAYIDATENGRPLYEAMGFVAAPSVLVNFTAPHVAGPTWKELERQCLPFRFWPMWRPVKGVYEGERKFGAEPPA